jgi:ATP-dependent Clp protease ATP-binding subunit ClpA
MKESKTLQRKNIANNVAALIRQNLVGQTAAVEAVCKAIRRLGNQT